MSYIYKHIRKPVGILVASALTIGGVALWIGITKGAFEGNEAENNAFGGDMPVSSFIDDSRRVLVSPSMPPDPMACPAGQVNELRVYSELNEHLPYEHSNIEVAKYQNYRLRPVYGGAYDPEHAFECMVHGEVTKVVELALPKLHQSIDERNAEIDSKVEPLRELEAIEDDHDRMVEAVKASCEFQSSGQYVPHTPPSSGPRNSSEYDEYHPGSNRSSETVPPSIEGYKSTVLVDASPASVERWISVLTGEASRDEIEVMPAYGKKGVAETASYVAIEEIYGEAWSGAFPVGEMPDPAFPRNLAVVAKTVCGVS